MKSIVNFTLILVAILAACGQAQPSKTAGVPVTQASDLVGIWQLQIPGHGTNYLLVRPDDTYSIAPNKDGSHGQSGTYSFINGAIDITNEICGQDSTYTVRRQDLNGHPETLLFTPVKAPCPELTGFLTQPAPTWVGPLPPG